MELQREGVMIDEVIERDNVVNLLQTKGFPVSWADGIIQVCSGNDAINIKFVDGLFKILDGETINRLSVLKALTGNPRWVDAIFMEAIERATKKFIRNRDPHASVSLKREQNNRYVISYEDQPIIIINSDDLFVTISGVSDEWDEQIQEIIINIDEELPVYFWTVPMEWTSVAVPILGRERDEVAMEYDNVDLKEFVFNYIASSRTLRKLMFEVIDLFFRQGGWLEQLAREKGIPYQERSSQIRMSKQVLDTLLSTDKKLIVEAPTGTGKTFAYLVPAYVIAWVMERTVQSQVDSGLIDSVFEQVTYRIAISTHTITLQKQIYYKDLPVIQEIFKSKLMFSIPYAIAMGRNNYICLRQTHEYLNSLENSLQGKLEGIDDEAINQKKNFVSFVKHIIEERGLEQGLIDELRNLLWDSYEDIFLDMQENIQSDTKNTLKDQCPFRDQCFYYRNKEKWQSANILIVNHYLLTFALSIFPSYFKTIYSVVVDEGHHFPEVVRQQMGRIDFAISGIVHSVEKRKKRFYEIKDWLKGQGIPYRLRFLQNMALIGRHVYEDYIKKLDIVEKRLTSLKMIIDNISESDVAEIVSKVVDDEENDSLSLPIKPIDTITKHITHLSEEDIKDILKKLVDIFTNLNVEIHNVEKACEDLIDILLQGYKKALYDMPSGEAGSLSKYIDTLSESISDLFSRYKSNIKEFIDTLRNTLKVVEEGEFDEECSEYAYWVEIRRDKRIKRKDKFTLRLQRQAVFSGELCCDLLSGTMMPFVFTSATMTTLGTFDFFMSSAGLNPSADHVEMEQLPPVFDYKSQMEILVPVDAPNVNISNDYIDFLADNLKKWLVASRGQALVLFTSVSMMKIVYEKVKAHVLAKGIDVYIQDNGMSRDMLLKTFKKNRYSVLFATKTFWEGIDVQGDSLQLLIITRLPFPNPNDINEQALKKCFTQQGRDKFQEYDLPVAGMLLRQAVGRLIRTESDAGIVIITDNRIINPNKSYAQLLQRSLPVKPLPLKAQAITNRLENKINRS